MTGMDGCWARAASAYAAAPSSAMNSRRPAYAADLDRLYPRGATQAALDADARKEVAFA